MKRSSFTKQLLKVLQSHGPKSCVTYLGVITAGAPSPGHAPAGYLPPANALGRKAKTQAENKLDIFPLDHLRDHLQDIVLIQCKRPGFPPSAAMGSGPVSEPLLPLFPLCSLSSSGSSALLASLDLSPYLITATRLL